MTLPQVPLRLLHVLALLALAGALDGCLAGPAPSLGSAPTPDPAEGMRLHRDDTFRVWAVEGVV
jgi:hypothetical protein